MTLIRSAPVSAGVRRVSLVCAALCKVLAVGIPVFVVLAWLRMSPDDLAESFRAPTPLSGMIEPWQRLLGALANLASASLLAFGLWRASKCLSDFARGEFFAVRTVRALRDFACATFWAVVIGLAESSVTSVIVSWTNGPKLRELAVGFGSQEVFSALYAGIFWVVAAALAHAASLASENEQFV